MQYMCIKRKRDNSYKVVFSLSLSCSKCWQHGLSVKGICFQIWIWAIEHYRQWFGIHNNSQGCRRQPRTCIDAIICRNVFQMQVSHFVPRFVHAQVNYNIIYIFRISDGIQWHDSGILTVCLPPSPAPLHTRHFRCTSFWRK